MVRCRPNRFTQVPRGLRLCAFGFLGLIVTACSIIPLSPSLSLTVQSSAYSSSTVAVPYSIATLSTSSGFGSVACIYALRKWSSIDGSYQEIQRQQTTLPSSGTLTFDLASLLGSSSGGAAPDGLYQLFFEVLSDNYDQNGAPIPIPYLTQTKTFTVYTLTTPEIFKAGPVLLNVTQGAQTVVLDGAGFVSGASGTTVTIPSAPSTLTAPATFVSATEMKAVIDPSSLTAGTQLGIQANDSLGNSSTYNMPIVSNVSIGTPVPANGSRYNSNLSVYVSGSSLGAWTTLTITDSKGNSATVNPSQTSSTYILGYVDLTRLTPGSATLTAHNPDGTSASAAFTVNS